MDSGAFDATDRIESAFGGTSSSSTFNVPEFSSSTPSGTSDYVEYTSTGPNGEEIRGYKKTFTSSTTSTKSRNFGGSGTFGDGGSLKLQTESIRDHSISPIPGRSSSSMSKLHHQEEVRREESSREHQHSSACSHAHPSHGLTKRPSSGGEKLAYSYHREEKRESRGGGGQTPRETPPSRKNVKWSADLSNKENVDIDFLPDPDLDKGKFISFSTFSYHHHNP